MAVKIQIRRDTSSLWGINNPVLLIGELGVETDTSKFKVGNGVLTWNSLEYATLRPSEIDAVASSAVAALVDASPGTLDTLNELAAAMGDDPNFATTVATQIGNKADSSLVSSHTGATTSVHGITDTSQLETQTGAQAKADMAQSSAQSYADGLASDYDIAGAAAAAQSSASSALSTHNSDTTSVHGISDTSLIATMLYADSAASSAVAALVDASPSTLDTLNELAAALGDDPNFATTVATQIGNKADSSLVSSHTEATTSVHGITDTSQLATTDFVTAAVALTASLASPTFTGTTNVESPTAAGSNGVRQITMSTAAPTGGYDGDIWLVYVQ